MTKLQKFAAAAVVAISSVSAQAALYTNELGSLVPGYTQNDDQAYGPLPIGFSLSLFGNSYTTFSVNNNGLATFGGTTSAYSPSPLDQQNFGYVLVTPFWTDLDSRGGAADAGVYFSQSAGQGVITWNKMGFYSGNYTGTVTFQLVLTDPTTVAPGAATIGFYYGDMSAGSDHHGVTAGFGDGFSQINPGELDFAHGLTSTVTSQLSGTSASFAVNDGMPVVAAPVPEPETYALMLAGLGVLFVVARRRKNAQ